MYDTDVYESMILLLAQIELGPEMFSFVFMPANTQHFIKV